MGGGRELAFLVLPVQVGQMIGYAVGEVVRAEEREPEGGVVRWRPQGSQKCYEIVTAWVHPGYRGLGVSVKTYLTIIRQGKMGVVWSYCADLPFF